MIIEEKRTIPKSAKVIKFFWEGSGNPAEVHRLLGVGMYDKDDVILAGIGDVEHKVDKMEDYETLRMPSPGNFEECVDKRCLNLIVANNEEPRCRTAEENVEPPEWCPTWKSGYSCPICNSVLEKTESELWCPNCPRWIRLDREEEKKDEGSHGDNQLR